MKAAALCLVLALFGTATAEPPSGYNYNRPQSISSGGGYSQSSSGGYSSGGSSGLSGGGSYQQVAPGPQTNEGANLDQGLLEQIKQVLLQSESQSSSSSSSSAGGYPSGPSSSYGAPSSSYGVPQSGGYQSGRVTGLDLEGIQAAIQIAQFSQQQQSSGGYPSGPSQSYGAPQQSYSAPQQSYSAPQQSYSAPQQSYSAPQQSYSAPSAPSSSYGAPSRAPSGSYGAPF